MKKNIIYLLLIPLLTFITCTEDDLTLTPTGQELESSFYQNDEQLAQALWAAYDPLQWVVWGANVFLWGSIASDDAYAGGSDPTDQDSYQLLDVYMVIHWGGTCPTCLLSEYYLRSHKSRGQIGALFQVDENTDISNATLWVDYYNSLFDASKRL